MRNAYVYKKAAGQGLLLAPDGCEKRKGEENMKKRILPLLLTAAMVAGLAGCGSSAAKETTAASDNNQTTAESTEAGSTTGEKILKVQVGPDPETVDPARIVL